jgi:hypothetical protein
LAAASQTNEKGETTVPAAKKANYAHEGQMSNLEVSMTYV